MTKNSITKLFTLIGLVTILGCGSPHNQEELSYNSNKNPDPIKKEGTEKGALNPKTSKEIVDHYLKQNSKEETLYANMSYSFLEDAVNQGIADQGLAVGIGLVMADVGSLAYALSIDPAGLNDRELLPKLNERMMQKIEEISNYLASSETQAGLPEKKSAEEYNKELIKLYKEWPNNFLVKK